VGRVADQADHRVATVGEEFLQDEGDLAVPACNDNPHHSPPSAAMAK
jgi:hypothetical protein